MSFNVNENKPHIPYKNATQSGAAFFVWQYHWINIQKNIILNRMICYHGSSVRVENPDLALSRKSLDFGAGFYTTVNKEQAIAFAQKVKKRRNHQEQIVNVYNFDIEAAERKLDIIQFASPDKLWLEFVHQNRHNIYNGKQYDLAVGPVANDDVYATLIIYEQGLLNIEQTIEALKVKKLFNQYVFKTDKALSFLHFADSFDAGEHHDS